jgi:hypothetical protein
MGYKDNEESLTSEESKNKKKKRKRLVATRIRLNDWMTEMDAWEGEGNQNEQNVPKVNEGMRVGWRGLSFCVPWAEGSWRGEEGNGVVAYMTRGKREKRGRGVCVVALVSGSRSKQIIFGAHTFPTIALPPIPIPNPSQPIQETEKDKKGWSPS